MTSPFLVAGASFVSTTSSVYLGEWNIGDSMGQGYSLTTLSAGSAGIDVPELSDLVYEKSMGGGRFMKSIRARQQNGLVFVKVIMKPYPTMQLEPYVKAIIRESRAKWAIG